MCIRDRPVGDSRAHPGEIEGERLHGLRTNGVARPHRDEGRRLSGSCPLGFRPALRKALRGVPPAESRRQRVRFASALALGAAAYLTLHALAAGRVPPGVAGDPVIEAMRGLRLVLLRRFEVLTVSIGPAAETLWPYVAGACVAALGPTRPARRARASRQKDRSTR